MELICPQCGRDRLWYDPYTGNFDCTTCGTPTLPEELTCPLCGKAGSLRTEDGILCCGSCGEAGKSNALKQVFADMDLMTDGAVCAGTVMAGFRCDIGNRGQHNKRQHYGQQARHKTKFLCHGLPSFAIL